MIESGDDMSVAWDRDVDQSHVGMFSPRLYSENRGRIDLGPEIYLGPVNSFSIRYVWRPKTRRWLMIDKSYIGEYAFPD